MLVPHCRGISMYVIVAASQKGGSGKTTLAGHLAVEASRSCAGEIALIDTDPQGSLAHWWNARQAPAPHFVKAGLPDLEEALAGLKLHGHQNRGDRHSARHHPVPLAHGGTCGPGAGAHPAQPA
jgi:cellulose biosynthesis protein BcsQ